MSEHPFRQLLDSVVDGGYCIGCGLCAAIESSPIEILLDDDGRYQARLVGDLSEDLIDSKILSVCPFTGVGADEDELAGERFAPAPRRDDVGFHLGTYAGHVAEGDYRRLGSSGGMAKWLLAEMLRRNMVDHVIQVVASSPEGDGGTYYSYEVHDDEEQIRNGSRAAYHPVELSAMIRFIRANPGRYAVTGLPCFIKGLRRLAVVDPVIDERIRYTVGLVCGHLKTTGYGESLAWQLGVSPDRLAEIDFRTKIPGRRAQEKGVTAIARDGTVSESRVVQELFGTQYQHGFFKYSACNFCDDVVAETADVSVGDAWLPTYNESGNSLVVVRQPELAALIEEGRDSGRLRLDAISPELAARSQAGGLRDRREGLAYRLFITDRAGTWRPEKRVAPSREIEVSRRLIYRLRMVVPQRSISVFRAAKERQDLDYYIRRMEWWVRIYRAVEMSEKARRRAEGRLARLGIRRRHVRRLTVWLREKSAAALERWRPRRRLR